jgi:hypothetical protein
MRLRYSQVSLRTLMLAVAAAATNLAAASLLLAAPFLRHSPAVAVVTGLFTIGVLLPALWLGAVRRLSYDGLLAHIAIVGVLVFLFYSAAWAETLTVFVLAYLAVGVLIPSVAWYIVRVREADESRDRATRLVMAYIKGVAQLSLSFGVWLVCLIIVYRTVG